MIPADTILGLRVRFAIGVICIPFAFIMAFFYGAHKELVLLRDDYPKAFRNNLRKQEAIRNGKKEKSQA